MFLKSLVRHGGIPFSLRLDEKPNAETIKAMNEVNKGTDLITAAQFKIILDYLVNEKRYQKNTKTVSGKTSYQ